MKIDETDLEQSFFEPIGKRVDKSIGYVLIGLVVVLFFSLFLFGMNRVQTVSTQAVGDHPRPVSEPKSEISEGIDSTKN